jgi:fluoride ion exporter CrcB/FEX
LKRIFEEGRHKKACFAALSVIVHAGKQAKTSKPEWRIEIGFGFIETWTTFTG